MKCPNCNTALEGTRFANTAVRQCPQCNGFLLQKSRVEKIRRRIDKDHESLKNEILESSRIDSLTTVRCPSCSSRMDKVPAENLDFYVDECGQCQMSWFDPGELARLQLAFEYDPRTIELNQMRDRLRNMTDEERAEYERRLAELPEHSSFAWDATNESAFDFAVAYYLSDM